MRMIAGLLSKNKNNVIKTLQNMIPPNLKNHEISILMSDKNFFINNFNKKEEGKLQGKNGVIICRQNDKCDNYMQIINDGYKKRDYYLEYGKRWDLQTPLTKLSDTKLYNGNFINVFKNDSNIILSKDNVGIKQLYYGDNSNNIGFCSRKKPLLLLNICINRLLSNEIINISENGIHKIKYKKIRRPQVSIFNLDEAIKKYKKHLFNSIKKRVKDVKKIGILFSGGVDSSIIAKITKNLGKDVVCYCAGTSKSPDIIMATEAKECMDIPFKTTIINSQLIQNNLHQLINMMEEYNQFQVEKALPSYFALKNAAKDGVKVVLTGEGADELFAGYEWYPAILEKEGELNLIKKMWTDLLLSYKESFETINKITELFDMELQAPYYDLDVIKIGMKISINLKLKEHDFMRKFIHRALGEELNIPLGAVWRDKDLTYKSSGVHDLIKVIALENGYREDLNYKFKTKIENLGSIYRYGNQYLVDEEKFGDNYIQAFFEDIAIDLGIANKSNHDPLGNT